MGQYLGFSFQIEKSPLTDPLKALVSFGGGSTLMAP